MNYKMPCHIVLIGVLFILSAHAQTTVDFDNPPVPDGPVGIFEGIDFTGWSGEGPFEPDPTRNIYFSSSPSLVETWTFSTPQVLTEIIVWSCTNCGTGNVTISSGAGESTIGFIFSDDGQLSSLSTIETGFTIPASVITIATPLGWAVGLTSLTYVESVGPPPPPPPVPQAVIGQNFNIFWPASINPLLDRYDVNWSDAWLVVGITVTVSDTTITGRDLGIPDPDWDYRTAEGVWFFTIDEVLTDGISSQLTAFAIDYTFQMDAPPCFKTDTGEVSMVQSPSDANIVIVAWGCPETPWGIATTKDSMNWSAAQLAVPSDGAGAMLISTQVWGIIYDAVAFRPMTPAEEAVFVDMRANGCCIP